MDAQPDMDESPDGQAPLSRKLTVNIDKSVDATGTNSPKPTDATIEPATTTPGAQVPAPLSRTLTINRTRSVNATGTNAPEPTDAHIQKNTTTSGVQLTSILTEIKGKSVRIGPYTFTVKYVMKLIGVDRTFAHIENTYDIYNERNVKVRTDTATFACYRSESELGLWRFCTFIGDDIVKYKTTKTHQGLSGATFFKGDDYVQGTMIHLQLQVLLNTCDIQKVASSDYLNFQSVERNGRDKLYNFNEGINWFIRYNYTLESHCISSEICKPKPIPVNQRDVVSTVMPAIPVIPVIPSITEARVEKRKGKGKGEGEGEVEEMGGVEKIGVGVGEDDEEDMSAKKQKPFLTRQSSTPVPGVDFIRLINDPVRRVAFEKFCGKPHMSNICGTKDENIYEQVKRTGNILGEKYQINPEVAVLGSYQVEFQEILKATCTIYEFNLDKLEAPTADNSLTLYFMTVSFEPVPSKQLHDLVEENDFRANICASTHFMPIILVPHKIHDDCTKWGLYREYVDAGAYICKLFDYSTAGHEQCTRNEKILGKISPRYSYIGNRYFGIWPYNIIPKAMGLTNCQQVGPFTNGDSTSKYKITYTKVEPPHYEISYDDSDGKEKFVKHYFDDIYDVSKIPDKKFVEYKTGLKVYYRKLNTRDGKTYALRIIRKEKDEDDYEDEDEDDYEDEKAQKYKYEFTLRIKDEDKLKKSEKPRQIWHSIKSYNYIQDSVETPTVPNFKEDALPDFFQYINEREYSNIREELKGFLRFPDVNPLYRPPAGGSRRKTRRKTNKKTRKTNKKTRKTNKKRKPSSSTKSSRKRRNN
jgi:hypothetical protein